MSLALSQLVQVARGVRWRCMAHSSLLLQARASAGGVLCSWVLALVRVRSALSHCWMIANRMMFSMLDCIHYDTYGLHELNE